MKNRLQSAVSSGRKVSEDVALMLADSARQAQKLHRVIFETCIASLNTKNLQTKDAKDLLGKLLLEVGENQCWHLQWTL